MEAPLNSLLVEMVKKWEFGANGTVISVQTFHRDKEYVPMRFSYL